MSGRSKKPRRIVVCKCCGKTGPHKAFGWRRCCYDRWRLNSQPDSGPPAPLSKAEVGRLNGSKPSKTRIEDIQEFAMVLRTRRPKPTIAEAAAAVGRSSRTGERYMKALRQMNEASQ